MQRIAPTDVIESSAPPFVEAVPDPFLVLTPVRDGDGELADLRVADANAAACEALGLTRHDLVGASFPDIRPAFDREAILAYARDVLRAGRQLLLSEVAPSSHRVDPRRFDARFTPVGDTLLLAWRDVTRTVELRDALAESERRFRMIAEHVTDFVIETGVDGIIRWASPSIERATGWRPDQVMGRPATDFIPAGKQSRAWAALAAAQRGDTVDGRVDLVTPDGSIRWFQRTGRPVRHTDGRVVAVVIGFRDVNAEVAAERTLAERDVQYRLVLENARDVIYLATTDGRLAWVSPSVTELLGWRPEDLIGTPTIDLIHPDDAPAVLAARSEAGTEPASLESRFRCADGSWRWMAVLARPLRDATGTLIGRTGSLRDIESERRSRDALEASEMRFRLLAENAADVVLHGLEDGIDWVSPSVRETLGWEPAQLIGRKAEDLVHPEDRHELDVAMAILVTGRPASATFRILMADGGYRWVSTVARPVLDDEGRFVGLTASLRDITALHDAQSAIEAFNATLETRVRQRTEELETFTRALSHDLRSPLRWIDGFAAMLERDEGGHLGDAGRHELAAIREAAQRMGRLADALLEWVRLGNSPVRPVTIEWTTVITDLRAALGRRGLDPAGFETEAFPAPVVADRELLRVALLELLDNAQRHAVPGGRARIVLSADRMGDRVRVAVTDDGIGIPEGHETEILEPFVRLRDEDVPGVGIGLPIARRAVRMLGSELVVRTGPGARIAFDLPPA